MRQKSISYRLSVLSVSKVRKSILIAGAIIALAVAMIDPTLQTLLYLAASGTLLAIAVSLPTGRARCQFSFLRVAAGPLMVLVSLCFAAALAEAALRTFFHQDFDSPDGKDWLGYRYDKTLGWFPVPNSSQT